MIHSQLRASLLLLLAFATGCLGPYDPRATVSERLESAAAGIDPSRPWLGRVPTCSVGDAWCSDWLAFRKLNKSPYQATIVRPSADGTALTIILSEPALELGGPELIRAITDAFPDG